MTNRITPTRIIRTNERGFVKVNEEGINCLDLFLPEAGARGSDGIMELTASLTCLSHKTIEKLAPLYRHQQ